MNAQTDHQMWNEQEELYEVFGNHTDLGLNSPRRSPMRHKEKLRKKDFKMAKQKKESRRLSIDKFELLFREE